MRREACGMWQVSHTHAPSATFSKSYTSQKKKKKPKKLERGEIKATQRQTAKVYKDF